MKTIRYHLLIGLAVALFHTNQLNGQIASANVPADPPTKTKSADKKKMLANVVEKGLHYVAYLNYTDRTVDRTRSGIDAYLQYKGMVINRVEIKVVKPFGTSLDEPNKYTPNRAERIANNAQVNTREWVVTNELLFHDGDTVIPILIAESERNLWDRGTFKDVQIQVRRLPDDSNKVNIIVLVRDRFSWSPYFKAGINATMAGFQFKNFLGVPQTITVYGGPNYRKDNPYHLYAGYSYSNIAKSHIDAGLGVIHEKLTKGFDARVSKSFYSPFSKWAWYFKHNLYKQDAIVPSTWVQSIPTHVMCTSQDAWLAHSTPFSPRNEKTDLRRIIVGWRFSNNYYLSRPFQHNEDYSQVYSNSWSILSGIGVANWDYYQDRNIYGLGEAEYFAKGWNSAIIYGLHHDEDVNTRLCLALKVNHGLFFKHFGYWFSEISTSGFITTEAVQQVNIRWQNTFFSAPLHVGKYVIRQFVKTKINLGFFQPPGHELIINNGSGDLRGFYYNTLQGQRSYSFSYQLNVYPPFKVLGFSSCVFAFADLAWIGQTDNWNNNRFAQSIGFGLRIRHLGLGLDFFEISLAYLPSLNIPGQKPMNVITDFDRRQGGPRNDLFGSGIISP